MVNWKSIRLDDYQCTKKTRNDDAPAKDCQVHAVRGSRANCQEKIINHEYIGIKQVNRPRNRTSSGLCHQWRCQLLGQVSCYVHVRSNYILKYVSHARVRRENGTVQQNVNEKVRCREKLSVPESLIHKNNLTVENSWRGIKGNTKIV